MTTRTSLIALFFGAATLTGCTAIPAPAPASSPAPSPAGAVADPSPPATPDAVEIDAVIIAADGIEVVDEAGSTVFAASYSDPIEGVLAGLEDAFDAAPVLGTDPGHIERLPYDTYAWDGLRIGEGAGADVKFDVEATGEATGGIEVRTPEGITIGTDAESVRAAYPDHWESLTDFDLARSPAFVFDDTTSPPRTFTIAVYLDAPATEVTRIYAPVDSQGP